MKNIRVIQGDITKLKVDAIVNAANSRLTDGSGVNGAIQRAGGKQILEACKKIGGCPTGNAVVTPAGNLSANVVVHAVGPIWRGGDYDESDLLASAYRNSLLRAAEAGAKTIAFPNISTGIFGFPKDKAATIAIHEVKKFVTQNPASLTEVIFCCYDDENYNLYKKLLNET
jgi:O-acetyl-ADP-ribose deacetylase